MDDKKNIIHDNIPILEKSSNSSLSISETIINDSRLAPTGNGNRSSGTICTVPTSGQKWWASLLVGFVFALISSPAAYYATSQLSMYLGGITLTEGKGPNFVGLLVHTLIFTCIIRIILW